MPNEIDRWEVAPVFIGACSAAAELFAALHELHSVSWVAAGKLMATSGHSSRWNVVHRGLVNVTFLP